MTASKYDGLAGDTTDITPPSSGKRFASPSSPETSPAPYPHLKVATGADFKVGLETLSPPLSPTSSPNPRKKRSEPLGKRLRAKGGLKINVNDPTLRQYKDYDPKGAPTAPFYSPGLWTGNTFGEPDIQTSLEGIEAGMTTPLPIFDIFGFRAVSAVLKDSAVAERLRRFADIRGCPTDIQFLQQVKEFDDSVGLVASTINSVCAKSTGAAATAPISLPLAARRHLNGNIRDAIGSLLPSLQCIFDEARSIVEQGVAQDVYPDFLTRQVSLSLQTIGTCPTARPSCPGFGNAFCLTKSREQGHLIVCASAGLAVLTGHTLGEMINENCRMFQGPGTRGSCRDRMREGLLQEHESTELVLNYTVNTPGSCLSATQLSRVASRPDALAYADTLY